MKTILNLLIFLSLKVNGYSQTTDIKDTSITFTSDEINISHSPSDFISKIAVRTKRFLNKDAAIEFSFITNAKGKPKNIRIDSLIFKTSAGKIFTLNHPYRDTVYFLNYGRLSLTTIHWLDKKELEVLRRETISNFVLIVDKEPIIISVSKKSQRQLTELINISF